MADPFALAAVLVVFGLAQSGGFPLGNSLAHYIILAGSVSFRVPLLLAAAS